MRFVIRMAAREMRASWLRLIFFFFCVSIGVGAIVALRSVVGTARVVLASEARAVMAADVLVQTNRAWEPALRRELDVRLASGAGAPVLARTDAIETVTMVRPADEAKQTSRIVELRGVEAAFPLYGQVLLRGGRPYSHQLLAGHGAIVRPELLIALGVDVGEGILIGRDRFEIRGVLANEPGRRLGAFSLGPRVLIDLANLRDTGLLTFGSRASHQIQLRVREERMEALVRDLRKTFGARFVNVRSYRATEDQIGRDLQVAEDYLSLVGFVILVLGGVGVWSVTRVFVQQRMRSVAILKCLGARTREVLAIYVAQTVTLGLAGSVLGVALAAVAVSVLSRQLSAALGTAPFGLRGAAALQGLAVGLLVSLLFSLVPLLDVRKIKPLWLLRDPTTRSEKRLRESFSDTGTVTRLRKRTPGVFFRSIDWVWVATVTAVSAALVGVAGWQAGSWRAGAFVSAGFVAVSLVLYAAGAGLVRALQPSARLRPFAWRHAVISLGRPGNQTRVVLLAVGLGSFFIAGVRGLQTNLVREFSLVSRPDQPDMFLIDIQPDQAARVTRMVEGERGISMRLLPVVRARVTGVRGGQVNLDTFEDVRGRGSLAREYVLTYRNTLEANERIIDGRFRGSASPSAPEVSIERSIRDRFRIQVGDTMRFDVLGRIISARVTSVREVEWGDSRAGGFMFVLNPASLAGAPHSFVGILRAPADAPGRARLQYALSSAFPNVSAIDVREVLAIVEKVVANVTLAVTVVGSVALVSGILILAGSVAMTRFQRLYEAAIFRTLGASTRTLAAMTLIEYGILGALAGVVGGAAAVALTWSVSTWLFEIPWHPAPWLTAGGVALTTLLVATVGLLSSLDVLRRKPLGTLRAE